MEYEKLTVEARAEILSARLLQAEADHYNHNLNAHEAAQRADVDAEARERQLADRAEARAEHLRTVDPSDVPASR